MIENHGNRIFNKIKTKKRQEIYPQSIYTKINLQNKTKKKMKFIQLHTKNTVIIYKNTLCSGASIIVISLFLLSLMIPIFLISLLNPHLETSVLYEKPRLEFEYKSIFVANTANYDKSWRTKNIFTNFHLCSTYPKLNEILNDQCDSLKVRRNFDKNVK